MPNPSTQITLELEGTPQEGGYLRLGDFLAQLRALRESLNSVNRVLERLSDSRIYYRIVDLSHAKGARVVLEPVTEEGNRENQEDIQSLHDRFFQELTAISENTAPSEEIDNEALKSFQKLVEKKGRSFSTATLHNSAATVKLDDTFKERVTTLINREFYSHGSLVGQLGKINVHGRHQNFWIFPELGASKVLCKFATPDVKEKAKAAIERIVTVRGRKYYRPNANFPYRIDVLELDPIADNETRKPLFELGGIAPNATGGKSAIDFITDLRDEWS